MHCAVGKVCQAPIPDPIQYRLILGASLANLRAVLDSASLDRHRHPASNAGPIGLMRAIDEPTLSSSHNGLIFSVRCVGIQCPDSWPIRNAVKSKSSDAFACAFGSMNNSCFSCPFPAESNDVSETWQQSGLWIVNMIAQRNQVTVSENSRQVGRDPVTKKRNQFVTRLRLALGQTRVVATRSRPGYAKARPGPILL